MSARLAVESLAARAAARLSRLAGTGGGTTIPGKLLWKLDPGAIDALAARLPQGAAVVSATNGKTTTTAMVAEISVAAAGSPGTGRARTSSPASRRRCSPRRDAELGLLEVDEGALPEVVRRVRPRAVLLGNLFRDQLDRYGELEHIAERWRAAAAQLPPETVLVVNGDDPQVGDLARGRAARSPTASTTPRTRGRRCSTPPTRATASPAATRTTSRPRTSGTSATTAALRAAMPGRSCTCGRARSSSTDCAARVRAGHARRVDAVELRLPGLYNVYNARRRRRARAGARRDAGRDPGRPRAGSAPRSGASSGSPPATRASCCC